MQNSLPALLNSLPDAFLLKIENASSTVRDYQDPPNEYEGIPTIGEIIFSRPPLMESQGIDGKVLPGLLEPPELLQNNQVRNFDLTRFALILDNVATAASGNTGIISVLGRGGSTTASQDYDSEGNQILTISIPVSCFVAIEAISGGYSDEDETLQIPHHLPFHGDLTLALSPALEELGEGQSVNGWRVSQLGFSGDKVFDYPEQDVFLGGILGDWFGNALFFVIDMGHIYPTVTTESMPRKLKVRPIWCGELSATPGADNLRLIRNQMEEAVELWERANIIIDVQWDTAAAAAQTPYGIDVDERARGIDPATGMNYPNRDLWVRGLRDFVRQSALSTTLGTIDIYFMNWFDSLVSYSATTPRFSASGGGYTLGGITGFAACFITDRRLPSKADPAPPSPFPVPPEPRRWMDYCVAHELGHVLGLEHPDATSLTSDGQLRIPILTVRGYRTDTIGGAALSGPMRDRMENMIAGFKNQVDSEVDTYVNLPAPYVPNTPATIDAAVPPIGTSFMANSIEAIGMRSLQEYINVLMDAAMAAPGFVAPAFTAYPVFLFFINEATADINKKFYVGMSSRLGFAIPVVIFNRGYGSGNPPDWNLANYPLAIRPHITRPPTHRAALGTVMDSQTPDPSVIDEEMCRAVSTGLNNSRAVMAMNPALELIMGAVSTRFKPDTRFGMYIPSIKGDVGRLSRDDSGGRYWSPFFWNGFQLLETVVDPSDMLPLPTDNEALKIRKYFYEPLKDNPAHSNPLTGITQYLYVHVRLRANHLPAESSIMTQADYSSYFTTKTRLFIAARFPGAGASPTTYQKVESTGLWHAGVPIESIQQFNRGVTAGSAQATDAHPYIAGLTYRYTWRPLTFPPHTCMVAFVINEDEPIYDRPWVPGLMPLISWAQVQAGWNFTNLPVLSDAQYSYLINENLQWIQRNLDIESVFPMFLAITTTWPFPPLFIRTIDFGIEIEPLVEIRVQGLNTGQLIVETFNGEKLDLPLVDGVAVFNPAGTSIRPGVYGMALSLKLEENTVIENAIVIDWLPQYGEHKLDGFRFELRNGTEEDFTTHLFSAAIAAFRAYDQRFPSSAATDIYTTLEPMSKKNLAELLNWLRSASTQSALASIMEEMQGTVAQDLVIISAMNQLLEDLQAGESDATLALSFKASVDRLHFLVMLHNGAVIENTALSDVSSSGISRTVEKSLEKTEEKGCFGILMTVWTAIRKLLD